MKIEDVGLSFNDKLKPLKDVTKIIVHHPAHKTWDIHDIHKAHKNKGWSGIGYNYFVTKDGRVQKGRGNNVGAHVSGHNSHTIGVSFQGNFQEETPTNEQLRAGAELIAQLIRDNGINIHDVIGHCDVAATVCPGKNFDLDLLRDFILEFTNPNTTTTVKAPKIQVKSEVVVKPKIASKGGKTVVKKGDRGKIVGTIQKLVGAKVDDIFGKNTEAKVKAFQKSKGLSQDGIVGENTWRELTGDEGGLLH